MLGPEETWGARSGDKLDLRDVVKTGNMGSLESLEAFVDLQVMSCFGGNEKFGGQEAFGNVGTMEVLRAMCIWKYWGIFLLWNI